MRPPTDLINHKDRKTIYTSFKREDGFWWDPEDVYRKITGKLRKYNIQFEPFEIETTDDLWSILYRIGKQFDNPPNTSYEFIHNLDNTTFLIRFSTPEWEKHQQMAKNPEMKDMGFFEVKRFKDF